MESQTEEIKRRIDIVEFIGQYLQLKPAGRNHKGPCPFHNEKTPSFMVNREKQIYKCFGCGEGGDIFDFVQKIEGLDFYDALKLLADRAGVVLKHQDNAQARAIKDSKNRLYELNNSLAQLYQTLLTKHTLGEPARAYVKKRGLSAETIEIFRIGFAPDNSTGVAKFLNQRGFTNADLSKAGNPERFRFRLMFPICDVLGNVLGFTGRALKDGQEPKYLNTRETPIFYKSKILYGLNIAKSAIHTTGQSVLVEGQMDVVMSHQAGVDTAVASSGTALTEDHLLILRRQANKVVLAFDNDDAGYKSTIKAIEMGFKLELTLYVVSFPDGIKDAGEAVERDPGLWHKCIEDAIPAFDWLWRTLSQKHDASSVDGKKQLTKILIPIVGSVVDAVERGEYIQRLARYLSLNEASIIEKMNATKSTQSEDDNRTIELEKPSLNEWYELLALLAMAPIKIEPTQEILKNILGKGKVAQLYFKVFEWYNQSDTHSREQGFLKILPNDIAKQIQIAVVAFEDIFADDDAVTSEIDKRIERLRSRWREKIKSDFAKNIALAEQSGDIEAVKKLLLELQSQTKS